MKRFTDSESWRAGNELSDIIVLNGKESRTERSNTSAGRERERGGDATLPHQTSPKKRLIGSDTYIPALGGMTRRT